MPLADDELGSGSDLTKLKREIAARDVSLSRVASVADTKRASPSTPASKPPTPSRTVSASVAEKHTVQPTAANSTSVQREVAPNQRVARQPRPASEFSNPLHVSRARVLQEGEQSVPPEGNSLHPRRTQATRTQGLFDSAYNSQRARASQGLPDYLPTAQPTSAAGVAPHDAVMLLRAAANTEFKLRAVPRTYGELRTHTVSRIRSLLSGVLNEIDVQGVAHPVEFPAAPSGLSHFRANRGDDNRAGRPQWGMSLVPPRPVGHSVHRNDKPATTISMKLPTGFLVCGPKSCAQVAEGDIKVSSSRSPLTGLKVQGRYGRDLQFHADHGVLKVSDPTLWEAEAGGLPGQIGTIWGHLWHVRSRGRAVPSSKSVVLSTADGQINAQDQKTRVDVTRAIRWDKRFGRTTAGYRFTVTTELRLPDGSIITERLHMAVRLVAISNLPPALRKRVQDQDITWGHVEPLKGEKTGRANSYAMVAASDVARGPHLDLVENPGTADKPPHPGDVDELPWRE